MDYPESGTNIHCFILMYIFTNPSEKVLTRCIRLQNNSSKQVDLTLNKLMLFNVISMLNHNFVLRGIFTLEHPKGYYFHKCKIHII